MKAFVCGRAFPSGEKVVCNKISPSGFGYGWLANHVPVTLCHDASPFLNLPSSAGRFVGYFVGELSR
jgi:hypothetical protein